jgi:purine-nucleoside/S-methyl-5'-thioadenosine phosphorylase / adenosine deaminase
MNDRFDSQYLMIPAFEKLAGITHAFTTRKDDLGVRSSGMKLSDDWEVVARLFGVEAERVVTVNQVHGEHIVIVNDQNFRSIRTAKADALITRVQGIAVGVETADCVPVLLVDPETPAAAAVHAGWRSTVKMIVRKAVKRMEDEFGSDPGRLLAAIGPSIGPECYEVDEPVMGPVKAAFSFWKEVAVPRGDDKWSLDLVSANRMELVQAGLKERNIHSIGLCTSCRRDLFYSFRAEGRTGRMLSAVMIKP